MTSALSILPGLYSIARLCLFFMAAVSVLLQVLSLSGHCHPGKLLVPLLSMKGW